VTTVGNMHRDGGGGIIGTPLDFCKKHIGAAHRNVRRVTPADKLAPPVALFLRLREASATAADYAAIRDVYKTPEELDATLAPWRKGAWMAGCELAAPGLGDIMDAEDRTNARMARIRWADASAAPVDGGPTIGKNDALIRAGGSNVPEIGLVPIRSAVGNSLLRAHGILASEYDREHAAADKRRKYRLGDLYSEHERAESLGRRDFGLGYTPGPFEWQDDGQLSVTTGPAKAAQAPEAATTAVAIRFSEDPRHPPTLRGCEVKNDVFDMDAYDGNDEFENVYGDARHGSLDAALARVRASMKRGKPSRKRGRKDSIGADTEVHDAQSGAEVSDLFAPLSQVIPGTKTSSTSAAASAQGVAAGQAKKAESLRVVLDPIPAWFARHPRHNPFATAPAAAPPLRRLHEYMEKVEQDEVAKLRALGRAVDARKRMAAERQRAFLDRARAGAARAMQSTFVKAGARGNESAADDDGVYGVGAAGGIRPPRTLQATRGVRTAIGGVSRRTFGWTPERIVCKRFGVEAVGMRARGVLPPEPSATGGKMGGSRDWKTAIGLQASPSSSSSSSSPSAMTEERMHDASQPGKGTKGNAKEKEEEEQDGGAIRVTGIVMRDGQVAVVGDACDGRAVEADGGEWLVSGTGGSGEALVMLGVSGSVEEDEEEDGEDMDQDQVRQAEDGEGCARGGSSTSNAAEARRILRRAVFGGEAPPQVPSSSHARGAASNSSSSPPRSMPDVPEGSCTAPRAHLHRRPRRARAADFF
jgi:hypothetical protein